jgi:hypothetical protein
LGQQAVADAVAGEAGIGVAGILAPGDAACSQELLGLGAGRTEQRPNQALGSCRQNSGQPG